LSNAGSFGEGLWGFDAPDDVGALLAGYVESPVAALIVAVVISLFIAVTFLGRTDIGSGAVGSAPPKARALLRIPSVAAQTAKVPESSTASSRGALGIENQRGRGAVQLVAKVKSREVLDFRLPGRRSNPSLERGPPGQSTVNAVARRRPSKPNARLGTTERGLR
jgi:hypothetical protein